MTGISDKLRGTIKPNGDHVWNSFGTIEDLKNSFESQIGDWRIALIYRKYKHERVTRDKEEDDIWSLKDDESSLEFTFDGVLRWKDFHKTSIEISLPIILHLYFRHNLNFSILWEKFFAHLLGIRTFVYITLTDLNILPNHAKYP